MDGFFNTLSLRVSIFFNLHTTAVVRVSGEIVSDLHSIDRRAPGWYSLDSDHSFVNESCWSTRLTRVRYSFSRAMSSM